jgi:AcrR family transcriptional regulator
MTISPTTDAPTKSDLTERHLLRTAVRLFGRKGFDRTTMRDIAKAADMSVGAAYYYYRSKEELVLAYYRQTQDEHERLLGERLPDLTDSADRIRAALRIKLELIADGRPFLGALFRFAGDPDHPLSVFGPATRELRQRSMATFARALDGSGLTGPSLELATTGLWALHLGLVLRAVYDQSPGLERTYALADAAATLVARITALAQMPGTEPLIAWLVSALGTLDGGAPEASAPARTSTSAGAFPRERGTTK